MTARTGAPTSRSEVQALTFVAAIAWWLTHHELESWNYQFFATRQSAPFSEAVAAAIDDCLLRGLLVGELDALIGPSLEGEWLLGVLGKGDRAERRAVCIKTACDAALTLPRSGIGGALSSVPPLVTARMLNRTEQLLHGLSLRGLEQDFKAIDAGMGAGGSALARIAIWLAFQLRPPETRDLAS